MSRDIAGLDMNRRKFIAATSVSVGAAGCLTGGGPDDGGDATGGDDADDSSLETGADDDRDDETGDASGSDGDEGGQGEGDGSDDAGETDDSDGDDADENEAGDESEPSERTTAFDSCTRATVTGTFADEDVAFANTVFYDEQGLVGDTILEDGIVFGDDVDAPFSGTVVFEIGDGSDVSESGDEIVVTVPDYGATGTVITSLTTEREDYLAVSPTTRNPDADECLADLEAEAGGDGGDTDSDSDADPSLSVSITDTNSPVDAGDSLEVTVEIANTGDAEATGTVEFVVGHDRVTVASRSVTLEAGERRTITDGYETPTVRSDQEFPIRVETETDSDERSVLVYGTE